MPTETLTPIERQPAVRFPVGVGQPIVLYRFATRSADQLAAIAGRRNGRDQIDLFEIRHGTSVLHECVRHIDDEFFEKNPDKANRQAAWDYVEFYLPQEAENHAAMFDDEDMQMFSGEAGEKLARRIVELQIGGKSPRQIVHLMATKGLTLKKVQAFLAYNNANQ